MTDDTLTSRANVVLHLDNGAEMQFSGRPFAGGSWFDDETGELTRQKLYTTESGEHVYSIVTDTGGQKNGFGGAIWNIKVYGSVEDSAPQQWLGLTAADFDGTNWHNNEGMLAGKFSLLQGTALRERMAGKDAITLQPGAQLAMTHPQLNKARKHTCPRTATTACCSISGRRPKS